MSTGFGESSYKLAKEAKRTADLLVSPYNEDLVHSICREVRMLHNKAESVLVSLRQSASPQGTPSQLAQVMLTHHSVKRSKRILFAYHRQRLEKLKELSWDVGRQTEHQREIKAALGPREHKFLEDYGELVGEYKNSFLDVDLGGNGGVGLDPPLDLYIEVRVLRDAGKINTEYGELNLTKGNQEFVRRSDVETLIKAGYLKHITWRTFVMYKLFFILLYLILPPSFPFHVVHTVASFLLSSHISIIYDPIKQMKKDKKVFIHDIWRRDMYYITWGSGERQGQK